MKQYAVQIADRAVADMDAIYAYIAGDLQAPDTAMVQCSRIAQAIESLNVFPERYKKFESQPERDLRFRQLPVDNYAAIYVVEGECVTVLRILYSASDIIARLRD